METIKKLVPVIVISILLLASCGETRVTKIEPTNPMQEALSRMPASIMELESRPLKMKAFIFNNIELTARDRGLPTWHQITDEELIHWILSMGHNMPSSIDTVVDLGKWRHTEFLNPSTWKMNAFDYTRDHEVIFSKADSDEYLTWMLRHNFEVYTSDYAIYLRVERMHHRDAYAFGSGVIKADDGATFICREIPTDGTLDGAYGIYTGESQSILAYPDLFEVSAAVPDDAFTSIICRLETSISKHNQVTSADKTGFSGVPLEEEQTIWAIENGRPEGLLWFSASHIKRDGHHGLLWSLVYDGEETATADLPKLQGAIATATGRFTKRMWWSEDLHLSTPEFVQNGNKIDIWAEYDIPEPERAKIESLEMTDQEMEELWLQYVRGVFDIFDKLERHDYGVFWQGY
ncbi:MAG TPA: hypothetical protein PKV16_05430 [Caldisericia bacterium]|nr:hypothetical protein [Caldisericia bacterium]HPF48753.1 hypothetical protein [Caldisericia bacterium]HPI83587.1 hypothetical protein [Caldisericia bacterium]HPQ93208.1 hypothetical protein [Caldisericia bacterium]HRV74959.1 hypothetical protein [Caldisericia bacterium]